MASLDAFILCFCALDLVEYARWFSIDISHENTFAGIQKIRPTLLVWALPRRTINVKGTGSG